ncbi:MAG: hypothetical protein PVSMB4_03460 [Ktedonobacterales bacterium]
MVEHRSQWLDLHQPRRLCAGDDRGAPVAAHAASCVAVPHIGIRFTNCRADHRTAAGNGRPGLHARGHRRGARVSAVQPVRRYIVPTSGHARTNTTAIRSTDLAALNAVRDIPHRATEHSFTRDRCLPQDGANYLA